jgi:recombination protein RecA
MMATQKGTQAANLELARFATSILDKYGAQRVANRMPPVIIPTGSVAVDRALRVGGVQQGHIYEVIGKKDSGKSSLGISIMVQHRLMFPDRGVAYVNIEDTFDPDRARAMGLDCSDAAKAAGIWVPLLAESSEMASDMADDVVSSGLVSCVVVDSIGAMESKKVLSLSAEKALDSMGKNARVITQMTKRLSSGARLHHCTVILINQPRANFSLFGGDISAGPKAMEHSTIAKIQMSALGGDDDVRKLKLEDEDDALIVSNKVSVKVPRLKNGLPGRVAETFLNRVGTEEYGPPGFDEADAYLSMGIRYQIVSQGGSHYTFPGGKKANGKLAAAQYLRDNPHLCKEIRAAITFDIPTDVLEENGAP